MTLRWNAHNEVPFGIVPVGDVVLDRYLSGNINARWLGVYVHAEWWGFGPAQAFWRWRKGEN